jgi:hypothetical protein
MNSNRSLTLSVWFDVDQTNDNLRWALSPDTVPAGTPGAGGLMFANGDTVTLVVTAYGSAARSRLSDFDVISACVSTKPYVLSMGKGVPTRYPAPSPFEQSRGASFIYEGPFDPVDGDPVDKAITIIKRAHTPLNVNVAEGRWELSLLLTVAIKRGAEFDPVARVFSFDPECQVGDGSNPGTD